MQVASRLFLMWAICWPFPHLNASVFYSSMLCAWSLTEVIRYTSYALKQVEAVPGWLNWLRYSAFLVLYPVGISSEVAMTLQALFGPASSLAVWYPYGLVLVLLAYIPGEWVNPGWECCDVGFADIRGFRLVHSLHPHAEAAEEISRGRQHCRKENAVMDLSKQSQI